MLTLAALREISQIAGSNFPSLIEACEAYHIDTPLRQAHFLAQCAHESAGFTRTVENLNYGQAALRSVFGRHFSTDEIAREYARQPERIANRAYASRMGNGDEASGDGWKYRGRGLIQLTGADNIRSFSVRYFGDLRLLRDPSSLERDPLASFAAGDFWSVHQCNDAADRDDIDSVTRAINGGLNGLPDRAKWLAITKRAMGIT